MATKPFKMETEHAPAGDQPGAIHSLVEGLQAGLHSQVLLGVTGSGKTFTVAKVLETVQRPTVVLAHNKTLAAQLYGEFREFFPHNSVEYFVSYYDYYQPEAYVPSSDTYIEKDASINAHIEQMRLSATKALMERRDVVVVATVSAIYGLGDPKSYLKMMLHLSQGEQVDRQYILNRLAELQYKRNDVQFQSGCYRVRGDVLDIYPAESSEEAVRLEWFDNEIEQISCFDALTGEKLGPLRRVTIYPSSHYVTPREKLLEAAGAIEKELDQRLIELHRGHRLLEAQRLEQRTRYDLEMIRELGYCNGIENYSRYLSGRPPGAPPPTLFDYLPEGALVVVDESHATIPQLGGMFRGDRSRKETLVEHGFRLPSALDNRPMRFEEWESIVPQRIFVSATPGPYERRHGDQVIEQLVRPTGLVDPALEVRPASTQVDDLLSELRRCAERDERALVTVLTKRMAEDLSDYLAEAGVRVRYLHSDIDTVERVEILRELRLGEFDVLVGINLLREGLDMPEVALVAILDADKEGFLRSESSLIQTVGRAARNLAGRAILYADAMTGSMERAIAESDRRRRLQSAYNKKHGITPQGIHKKVLNIMDDAYQTPGKYRSRKGRRERGAARREAPRTAREAPINTGDARAVAARLRGMEKRMQQHARNLEFEEAARLRDELRTLKNDAFRKAAGT